MIKKYALKALKASARFLTSFLFISTLISLLVAFAIWTYGPRLVIADYRPLYSETSRLIALIVVTFIWGLNNLLLYMVRPRAPKASKEEKARPPRNPIEEKVATFTQTFEKAILTIRKNWLGGNTGAGALYALPWYVLMGFNESGKTTLVSGSNLKFPLAHLFGLEEFKNIRATETVDYWVTNEAVVFDLAGGLLYQPKVNGKSPVIDASTAIWHAFLNLLHKHRPRRPINGVILCIDICDLLCSTEEVRLNKAATLHARLVEMSNTLGTRYTLHVLFTKLDLLEGFHEFFSALPASRRTRPFGFSFQMYRENQGDVWLKNFIESYDAFLDRLNNDMIERLFIQRNTQSRRKTYVFIRELAGLRSILENFLQHALHHDLFSTPPLVRGLYFSSARQEGVPVNAMVKAVTTRHGLPEQALAAHSDFTKPYFSPDLLKDVVFVEAGLAGDNVRVEQRKRMMLMGTFFASAAVITLFSLFLYTAHQDNKTRSASIVERVIAFKGQQSSIAANPQAGYSYLEPLAAIREASGFYEQYWEKTAVWSFLSLYQGKRIGPEVNKAYEEILSDHFMPALALAAETRIRELGQVSGKDGKLDPRDSDERLEALRVYLMLGDQAKRASPIVEGWFADLWQGMLEGNSLAQGDLMYHLNYAINNAGIETAINEPLVRSAQAELQRIPRDLRLYTNIEQLGNRQLVGGVNLRNEIGPAFNIIFQYPENLAGEKPAYVVKPLFTRERFENFFVPHKDSLSKVAVEDAWVAGERQTVAYSDEDLKAFKKKVTGRYATQYIRAWEEALNNLEITNFRSVDHGVDVLEQITGPNAPFERLIAAVKAETEIYTPKTIELEKEDAINAALPFDENREQGLRISRAFTLINGVVTPPKDGEKPPLEDMMTAIGTLYEYLKEIKQAGNRSGEVALEKAKARITLKGDDPIYAVERLSSNLPEPLNRFFAKIADESWRVVLDHSKEQLHASWNEKIYSRFHTNLAIRYPFDPNATEDVSLKEFEEFFGPGGAVESFYKENLALFLNETTGEPKVIDGHSLDVSKTFLDELQTALSVGKYYFDGKGALQMYYQLQPKSLSRSASRATIWVEGQTVPYRNSATSAISIRWPNVLSGKVESKLTLSPAGSKPPETVTYAGPWSGFRLMDQGEVSNVTKNSADITFKLGNMQVIYTITTTDAENVFVTKPLQKLSLPARL